MLKKIFKNRTIKSSILSALGLLTIVSCTTNDVEDELPANARGRAFALTSLDRNLANSEFGSEITGMINVAPASFNDLSILTNGRTWTFPEGFVDILGASNNTTSSDKEVFVVFKRIGEIEVKLEVDKGGETEEIFFPINVLPRVDGSFGASIEPVDGKITIPAGENLVFNPTNIGNPDENIFVLTNISTDEIIDQVGVSPDNPTGVVYNIKSLGNYRLTYSAENTKFDVKATSSVLVEVVPSDEPLEFSSVNSIVNLDRNIELAANKEIQEFDGAAETSNFIVKVDGGNVVVTQVNLSNDDASRVIVEVDQTLVPGQEVVISYVGGNIVSTDFSEATPFDNFELEFDIINFFADTSYDANNPKYENGERFDINNGINADDEFAFGIGGGWFVIEGGETRPDAKDNRTTEFVSGDTKNFTSFIINVFPQRNDVPDFTPTAVDASKEYRYSFWAKVKDPSFAGQAALQMWRGTFERPLLFENESGQQFNLDNGWKKYVSQPFSEPEGDINFTFQFKNIAGNDSFTLIIDDIALEQVEE